MTHQINCYELSLGGDVKDVFRNLRLEAFEIYTYYSEQAEVHIQDISGLYIMCEGLL